MAILTCTLRELLVLTDTSEVHYRQDKFRQQGVAAFGCDAPVLEDRPLLLDVVAVCIRDQLSNSVAASLPQATPRGGDHRARLLAGMGHSLGAGRA